MLSEALDSWEALHGQPALAILFFFVCATCSLALEAYMLYGTRTTDAWMYAFRVPLLVQIVTFSFQVVCCFRLGHLFLGTTAFKAIAPLALLSGSVIHLLAFLCPTDAILFGSSLHCTAIIALNIFATHCTIVMLPVNPPSEPCKSPASLVIQSLVSTLRICDGLTDLAVIRVFQEQVWCPSSLRLHESVACELHAIQSLHLSSQSHLQPYQTHTTVSGRRLKQLASSHSA